MIEEKHLVAVLEDFKVFASKVFSHKQPDPIKVTWSMKASETVPDAKRGVDIRQLVVTLYYDNKGNKADPVVLFQDVTTKERPAGDGLLISFYDQERIDLLKRFVNTILTSGCVHNLAVMRSNEKQKRANENGQDSNNI